VKSNAKKAVRVRKVAESRKIAVALVDGPFGGKVLPLSDATGTLPIRVNGQRGRYVAALNGNGSRSTLSTGVPLLRWEPLNV
jgi:hypothetical protein